MYVQGGRREGREKGAKALLSPWLGAKREGRCCKRCSGFPASSPPFSIRFPAAEGGKDEVGNGPPLRGHSSAAEGGRKMQQQPSRKICVAQVGSKKNTCRKGEKGFSLRFSPQRNSPKKHFHPIIVSCCNVCIVQWAHGFAREICTAEAGFFLISPLTFALYFRHSLFFLRPGVSGNTRTRCTRSISSAEAADADAE